MLCSKLLLLWAFCQVKAFNLPESSPMVMSAIDKVLTFPIQDIPHLNVMLRAKHFQMDSDNSYTRFFLEHSHCPLTISIYEEPSGQIAEVEPKMYGNRDSFVIVTNMKQLRPTSKRFVQRAGIFFFIFGDEIIIEELREILHLMWMHYNVYKNYMLTKDGILIYDPFEFDEDQKRYGKIVKYTGERQLERVLFSDMRGYPLRIQIFKSVYARPRLDKRTGKIRSVDGVDGKVATLLQERMNFTTDLQEPDPDYFGERDANGTYNGAIGSIINNEIDMCLTGFFVKDYMAPEVQFSVAVYDDQLCIYVPKAKRIPQSILPIFAVRYDVWLGFILAAFVCGTIWWLLRRINLWLGGANLKNLPLHKSLKHQFVRIYIDTWVVWVRVNIVRYPPFYSEKVFVMSLCLVSVIFGAVIESSLATVYIHPMYYKDINTLHELDESGLKVIYKYSSMADDLFFSDTSPLFANLNKKLTHLSDLNADVILDVAENGGKAGVTRYTSLMLESLHFIIAKQVWIVHECPKLYTISYVMPKDSPWEETVNNLLLRLLNAGLIGKWIAEMEAEVDIKVMVEQRFESNDTFKILTVIDLQLSFYVILVGNMLAAISFFVEQYLLRRRQRKVK